MKEYIIGVSAEVIEKTKNGETVRITPKLEEVVRCRNCAFFAADSLGDYCTLFGFEDVKPMGGMFCAWGVRKDD